MEKRRRLFAGLAAALFLLSGCSLAGVDELYSLPQAPKEYLQLQELIDAEIRAGSEYSAPTAGSLRQSIQLTDLDGDGTNEALAFLRNKDMQPEICVYRKTGEDYTAAATIVGDGSAIGRVEYDDLDGDGISEIIVSWEVSTELRLMKVYSMKNWKPDALMTASCLDFQLRDLNLDGNTDVVALSLDTAGGKVDMYSIDETGNVVQKSAKLSVSLRSADRFRIAQIADGVPAVFVEGPYSSDDGSSSWLLTDIVVWTDGELRNITRKSDEDSAAKRRYPVYSTDIDGNGSLDVPFSEKLDNTGSAEFWVFDWYTYDAEGNAVKCASTYHNYTDGWFLVLPDEWRNDISVRRESSVSGERSVVFSTVNEKSGTATDMLAVYTLTDENRTERAETDGRFVLMSSGTVVYAAKIINDSAEEQDIMGRFHLISSEFNTGTL